MRELTKHFEFTHTLMYIHMYVPSSCSCLLRASSKRLTIQREFAWDAYIQTYMYVFMCICMYEHTANFRLRKLQCCMHTYACMYICMCFKFSYILTYIWRLERYMHVCMYVHTYMAYTHWNWEACVCVCLCNIWNFEAHVISNFILCENTQMCAISLAF